MAEPTGLGAVLADATADRPLMPAPAEQPDLLAELGTRVPPPDTVRPRGRPAGAINRRTERVAEYLLSKYPDPLEGLLRMSSLGIEEMRAALGCTAFEAFQEKRLCLQAALPYVHRRMPLAVEVAATNVVHLAIHTGPEDGAGPLAEGGETILGTIVEIEQNQQLGEVPDAAL